MRETIYLGLGTNSGDRFANLKAAVRALEPVVAIESISGLYETEPWGYVDQPAFYNLVLKATSTDEPLALLDKLKALEVDLGRTPTFRYGPRVIDLDILFYDDQVIDYDRLTVPHPRLHERAFVLVPLADLAPNLIHPLSGRTVSEILTSVDTGGIRHIYSSEKVELAMRQGLRGFHWGSKTYLMGILNVTPDSFSGDGLAVNQHPLKKAVAQAESFIRDGAQLLDVGGESTRPGAAFVSADEEVARVVPVIRAIRELDPAIIISVDTYKASVAEAALAAGADWMNDVWSLAADPRMRSLAANIDCPVILMHNRSKPAEAQVQAVLGGHYVGPVYQNLLADVKNELQTSVNLALEAGVKAGNIIVDPGFGFGKTISQNLTLIDRLDELKSLGYPLLLAASRKSFIGYTLDLPPDQRAEGTAAVVSIGIDRGADMVRVHDVSMISRIVRMTDAIVRQKNI